MYCLRCVRESAFAVISVIITAVNDPRLQSTVRSIRATSDAKAVEVIVVDDCSATKIYCDGADVVVRNQFRCGCGPSRHIGVLHAQMPWVLLVDAHVQFPAGWYEAAEAVMRNDGGNNRRLFCYPCGVLDKFHQSMASSKATYWNGATINLYGPDRKHPKQKQVLEARWADNKGQDGEIACVMGASYLLERDWFLSLSALRFLKSWGSDEIMLSLKNWLFGGKNYVLAAPPIYHYFYSEDEKQGFSVKKGHTLFNKMFACHTLMPPVLAQVLIARMRLCYDGGDYSLGLEMIRESWPIIEIERTRNEAMAHKTFQQYVERFGIPLPGPTA